MLRLTDRQQYDMHQGTEWLARLYQKVGISVDKQVGSRTQYLGHEKCNWKEHWSAAISGCIVGQKGCQKMGVGSANMQTKEPKIWGRSMATRSNSEIEKNSDFAEEEKSKHATQLSVANVYVTLGYFVSKESMECTFVLVLGRPEISHACSCCYILPLWRKVQLWPDLQPLLSALSLSQCLDNCTCMSVMG